WSARRLPRDGSVPAPGYAARWSSLLHGLDLFRYTSPHSSVSLVVLFDVSARVGQRWEINLKTAPVCNPLLHYTGYFRADYFPLFLQMSQLSSRRASQAPGWFSTAVRQITPSSSRAAMVLSIWRGLQGNILRSSPSSAAPVERRNSSTSFSRAARSPIFWAWSGRSGKCRAAIS